MDVAQNQLEVEVLIHLRRSYTHIASGRKTPVGGLDFGARDNAAKPRDGYEFSLRESRQEPLRLALEVSRALELLDQLFAAGIEFLFEAPDGAAIPVVVIVVAVLLGFLDLHFGGVHQPDG